MNKEEAIPILLNAVKYFEQQSAGYKSWGKVNVLQIAIRLNKNDIILTSYNKPLDTVARQDIIVEKNSNTIFHHIFTDRKNVQVILLTHQQYASKVTKEIPPILDDQAQLLGISIRIAKTDNDILYSLKGRFASILPNGNSICLGNSLEDAYVAAQLLEKTSKAFIEAEYLGGAKSINKIEAWLMQKFYQLKYAKEAKKNK